MLGTAPWQLAPAGTVTVPGVLNTVGGVVSATANANEPVELFPAASVTVTTIACWPTPTSVPAGGACMTSSALAGVQLSVATTCDLMSGTAVWQFAVAERVPGVAPLTMTGGVVSATEND